MARLIGLAMAAMVSAAPVIAQEVPAAIASIVVEHSDSSITLSGQALALTNGRYDARMKIERSGTAGRTSTTQGGQFALSAGEVATVATVGLSLSPDDVLAVELVLTVDGQEVSRNRLSVGN